MDNNLEPLGGSSTDNTGSQPPATSPQPDVSSSGSAGVSDSPDSTTSSVTSTASSVPGAIASTPDIVAPPTDEQVSAAASQLSPARNFFGKRPTEMAVRSGVSSNPSASTPDNIAETGDIVLNTPKPSSKKKFIILGVIAAALVFVAVISFILLRPKTSAELSTAFAKYSQLLQNGPSGDSEPDLVEVEGNTTDDDGYDYYDEDGNVFAFEEGIGDDEEYYEDYYTTDEDEPTTDEDESVTDADDNVSTALPTYYDWYLFQLNDSNLAYDSQKQYIDQLKTTYDDFRSVASRGEKQIAHLDEIQSITQDYGTTLEIISLWSMLNSISGHVEELFLEKGEADAAKYINEIIPGEYQNEDFENIRQHLEKHLQYQLELLHKYVSKNCVTDHVLDATCAVDVDLEDAASELIMSQNENYDDLYSAISTIWENFAAQTEKLSDLLGEVSYAPSDDDEPESEDEPNEELEDDAE